MNTITSFSAPGDGLVNILDEFYVPAQPSPLYVADSDYQQGVFYDHKLGNVYSNKYRDLDLPANSIFSNEAAIAQQSFTTNSIITNNTTYVENIVQNNVTTQLTQVLGVDNSTQLSTLGADILTLKGSYATLTSALSNNDTVDQNQATEIWNNSASIAALQLRINNLNPRNISLGLV